MLVSPAWLFERLYFCCFALRAACLPCPFAHDATLDLPELRLPQLGGWHLAQRHAIQWLCACLQIGWLKFWDSYGCQHLSASARKRPSYAIPGPAALIQNVLFPANLCKSIFLALACGWVLWTFSLWSMFRDSSLRLCLGSRSTCPPCVRIHPSPISMELDPGRLLEIVGWGPEAMVTCTCVDSIPGPHPGQLGTFARRGTLSSVPPSSNAPPQQRRDPFSHVLTLASSWFPRTCLLLSIRGSEFPFHRHFRGHRPR